MATKRVALVFVLPVVLSLIFGTAVMVGVLQDSEKELNMWPMTFSKEKASHGSLSIIGLSKQYSTSEPVELQVKISDSSFNCGDLYVTIYESGKNDVITQGGFFKQCFEEGSKILPIGDDFSRIIGVPGTYEVVIEMISTELKTISTKGTFTIK